VFQRAIATAAVYGHNPQALIQAAHPWLARQGGVNCLREVEVAATRSPPELRTVIRSISTLATLFLPPIPRTRTTTSLIRTPLHCASADFTHTFCSIPQKRGKRLLPIGPFLVPSPMVTRADPNFLILTDLETDITKTPHTSTSSSPNRCSILFLPTELLVNKESDSLYESFAPQLNSSYLPNRLLESTSTRQRNVTHTDPPRRADVAAEPLR
jgi:hypothetical protein